MNVFSLGFATTFALVAQLGVAGFVQIIAPGFVRRAYQRWGMRPQSYRVSGALQLLAAYFLAMPSTRLWGIAMACILNFIAVVVILGHREYGWALPGFAAQIALFLALLAAATL